MLDLMKLDGKKKKFADFALKLTDNGKDVEDLALAMASLSW